MSTVFLNLVPHQDDELITLGVETIASIRERREENHVLIFTDGSASGVHRLLANGRECSLHGGTHHYRMSRERFVAARDREFTDSCRQIGYSRANIHFPKERLRDGEMDTDGAYGVLKGFLSTFRVKDGDRLVLRTISPYGGPEQHSDHTSLGYAAVSAYKNGLVQGLELYQEPYCVFGLRETHKEAALGVKMADRQTKEVFAKACSAYGKWRPLLGRFAVGVHSMPDFFEKSTESPASYAIGNVDEMIELNG